MSNTWNKYQQVNYTMDQIYTHNWCADKAQAKQDNKAFNRLVKDTVWGLSHADTDMGESVAYVFTQEQVDAIRAKAKFNINVERDGHCFKITKGVGNK